MKLGASYAPLYKKHYLSTFMFNDGSKIFYRYVIYIKGAEKLVNLQDQDKNHTENFFDTGDGGLE